MNFEKLIAEVNVYSEERSELLNVAEFHSYVETCGFYTPQEVCAVQSVKEANESINIGNGKKCNTKFISWLLHVYLNILKI